MVYLAVSLPTFLVFDEDLSRLIKIHCHQMIALGFLGLELKESAEAHLRELLKMEIMHLGANLHRQFLI